MMIILVLFTVEDDIEKPKRGAIVSPDSQVLSYTSKTNIGKYYLGKYSLKKKKNH